ncbi:hypothetical protein BCU85_05505 [Vibrio lentus]|uniref:antitoxin Xre/MbcA/ParS toxin-binding domain-containing protein n=1 Tax=Vibrio lentus TaxID=136468 RepID=UPI000C85BF4D|nr:antitoxin Xre/MbcA/ParS toxin-binding domain-containing protein [Vibrio lentus]PMG71408.1 hypothetical protein BCU85_05505 [Vibrio lentus]PMM24201.1 hypothetical protein BCT57_09425 [Vibrio lentus]
MDSDKEIKEALLELLVRDELVDEWLNTKKWFWSDLTPLEVLKTPNGKKSVLTMINRIKYGDLS